MLLNLFPLLLICTLPTVIALSIMVTNSLYELDFLAYGKYLSVDPTTNIVYIQLENSTLTLNGSSGKILNHTDIYGNLIINPSTKQLYIAESDNDNMTVFNMTNFVILTQKILPNYATQMAIDQERNILYVVDDDSITDLTVLNGTDMSVHSYEINGTASNIAVNPAKNRVYILDNENDKIYVFDPEREKVRDRIPIMPNSYDIAVNPLTNEIFVSSIDGSRIEIIDGNKNNHLKYLITGSYKDTSTSISINPQSNQSNLLYMGDYQARKLSIFNISSESDIAGVPLNISPSEISVNTQNGEIFIFDSESSALSKVSGKHEQILYGQKASNSDNNANRFVNGINFNKAIQDAVIDPQTNKIYMIVTDSKILYTLDSTSNEISQLKLDYQPVHIKQTLQPNRLLITYQNHPGIYLIDTETNQSTFIASNNIPAATIDSELGNTYAVVNTGDNNILHIFRDYDELNFSLAFAQANDLEVNPTTERVYISGESLFVTDPMEEESTQTKKININEPTKIFVDPDRNVVYVLGLIASNDTSSGFIAAGDIDTLFLMDGATDTILDELTFESDLIDIVANKKTNTVYVSSQQFNFESDFDDKPTGIIYVVNASTNKLKLTHNLTVGTEPRLMIANEPSNLLYIFDPTERSIFLMDTSLNNLVSPKSFVSFETVPNKSGDISCNKFIVTDRIIEYAYNTKLQCEAKPYSKFRFASWDGDVHGISSNISFKVKNDTEAIANFSEVAPPPDVYLILGLIFAAISTFYLIIRDYIKKQKRHQN